MKFVIMSAIVLCSSVSFAKQMNCEIYMDVQENLVPTRTTFFSGPVEIVPAGSVPKEVVGKGTHKILGNIVLHLGLYTEKLSTGAQSLSVSLVAGTGAKEVGSDSYDYNSMSTAIVKVPSTNYLSLQLDLFTLECKSL